MSDVTIIGLGEMGGALANCLVQAGKIVTIWNRTAHKAAPLVAAGATLATSPRAAVAASPVIIICISDYSAALDILSDEAASSALAGRLVVHLTSGTPRQAREMATWVEKFNALYLDGAVLAWPRQIGARDATILVSGKDSVYTEVEPLLRSLAGNLTNVGTPVGNAVALFNAALAYLAGHWIGFSYGAVICESEGLDVQGFGEMMRALAPILGEDNRHMGRAIAGNLFERPESTLKTAGTDIARLVQLAEEAGIGAEFPIFAASIFQKGIEAGFGPEEHCAVFKILRTA
ncbi:NAD(P)-dependent oxidoreductase [Rhizobium laguerreae]|uniref:NAD(P)-dependent oxidoreductase n=1 Tax=Rhizobium laguerreae TaxID=1076926 RepID=UPI001C8FF0F7|nr:NAD(P)-dependent oxidoreductase [Rhizobium laguerreae]MBY3217725.1 NAD(P)-dependent oxidoreductase [Rhizobium laguerreae]